MMIADEARIGVYLDTEDLVAAARTLITKICDNTGMVVAGACAVEFARRRFNRDTFSAWAGVDQHLVKA